MTDEKTRFCPRRQCRGRVPHSWLIHWFGWADSDLDLDSMRMPWRDRLALAWIDLRKRFRRCPECERRGYGDTGPGPGKTYRWVDDPVVIACGFQTAPHRCNTCGQEPSARPGATRCTCTRTLARPHDRTAECFVLDALGLHIVPPASTGGGSDA